MHESQDETLGHTHDRIKALGAVLAVHRLGLGRRSQSCSPLLAAMVASTLLGLLSPRDAK